MAWGWEYRYEAVSVEGFVQQLAVSYVKNRYWLYILGEIPPRKDPRAVDEKLILKYGVAVSKWAKYRATMRGEAKVQYLRYGPTFVLLATVCQGDRVFEDEKAVVEDVREKPIPFYGYSIGCKDGQAHVRIGTIQYELLTEEFLASALRFPVEVLGARFRALPFEPYGPVKRQVRKLLFRVNRARRAAGLPRVPVSYLRDRRRSVKPFEAVPTRGDATTVGRDGQ